MFTENECEKFNLYTPKFDAVREPSALFAYLMLARSMRGREQNVNVQHGDALHRMHKIFFYLVARVHNKC